ncbi:sensor histidine kinase [Microtetraspora glauca]|uniref:histidine kinase n=1 Tax=Microtetraspora glauca TaxID=1996 RepID=A0ABV3GU83_MICGL
MLSTVRHRGPRGAATDAALAAAVLGCVSVSTTDRIPHWLPHYVPLLGGLAQAVLVLLWRRRAPGAVLGGCTILGAFMIATGVPVLPAVTGTAVAAYATVVYGSAAPGIAGAGASVAAVVLVGTNALPGSQRGPTSDGWMGSVAMALIVAVAGVAGYAVRTRRAYVAELEERAARLEREEGERAARAVADERLRIARELHDVIGHSISLIAVQSEAAGRSIRTNPVAVPGFLTTISASSREALAEMRRVLAVLRPDGDDGDLEPQPGLDALPELVARVQAAGLPVRLDLEPRALPSGVGLAVYRIVQEALTNTLKHAGPATAHVTVARTDSAVIVTVLDDGRGPDGPAPAAAHGLVGMRERAAMYDGTLHAGPGPHGGFEIRAVLSTPEEGTP